MLAGIVVSDDADHAVFAHTCEYHEDFISATGSSETDCSGLRVCKQCGERLIFERLVVNGCQQRDLLF